MASSASIPLHCNICPKKPNFSDVSHLLTHIASKGHLSHYYKVKVRSTHEEPSRRLIESYDRWYIDWRVEDLMSERMNMKDKKKSRPRSGARNSHIQNSNSAPDPRGRRTGITALDPRLINQRVKEEPRPTPPPFFDGLSYARQYDPRMARFWAGMPDNLSTSSYGTTSTEFDYPVQGQDTHRRVYHAPDSSAILEDNDNDIEEPVSTVGGSECTKLKGVYWPGMNIFDSATPEMRRKRNQKKDISVLEQLELNSHEVEPTELIFTPNGSFKRQRRISGSSEESSPLKSELSPRESRSKRPALTEVDSNIPRRARQAPRNARPNTAIAKHDVFADDRLDFGLNYNSAQPRRRGFQVFNDQNIHTAQPADLHYLTSEFHYGGPNGTIDGRSRGKAHSRATSLYHQQEEKENYDHQPYHYTAFYAPLPAATTHQYNQYPSAGAHDLPPTSFYSNSVFYQAYQTTTETQGEPQQDDQRTITAPPSPEM
ncbi:hypothetical protein EJ05DRAFT_59524 [Pseudovirgaria hyperparasitica]|uniref:Uncharacterized protein n=1 Tax=Pseudovirgaria hyperparasitica TaxID=470096 RepID=A0A6A6W306_9PEZI|nr:uncharacterized protein EJ05DRAFT_59524 [Pseudovirgaria hyperparasitica]KAF2757232.1 hypothetical protein EJ05DRAFT_59524 [Pseudovirgaria hyperparasitica]